MPATLTSLIFMLFFQPASFGAVCKPRFLPTCQALLNDSEFTEQFTQARLAREFWRRFATCQGLSNDLEQRAASAEDRFGSGPLMPEIIQRVALAGLARPGSGEPGPGRAEHG